MGDVEKERRQFLKGAAVGTGGIVVAAIADATTGAQADTTAPVPRTGYRMTRHIRDYYNKARF